MSSLLSDRTEELAPREVSGGEEAGLLVKAERLRLARELHDVVSFGFATIALQAGVATHHGAERPEQALEALHAIRVASRDVLDEVRAILGQLREDDETSEPARGIGRLESLAASTSSAGVLTTVQVSGRPRPLPVAVDLAVYRIVQEALANVLRHSPAATARVSVVYARDHLRITIEDDGVGRRTDLATEGSGYGIIGMRERALALGGALDAGPRPDGGFCVQASIPFLGRP
jgi:signal transduction histidine kinase